MSSTHDTVLKVGDALAATVTISAIMSWIPPLVAVLNAVYIVLRLFDWIEGRVDRARAKQKQSK